MVDAGADWVCEVLSPSTACLDRVQKRRIYALELDLRSLWDALPPSDPFSPRDDYSLAK